MRRLMLLPLLAVLLMGASVSENLDVAITQQAQTATCPQGDAYADGCVGAQATGTASISNFFTGYTGTNYPIRPPWNVAGVDYPVGYDGGTLKDPSVSGNLPSCAKYSINNVSVVSTPCIIDHFDFSLHNGICLSLGINSSSTITVTNNKFRAGTGCEPTGFGLINITGNSPVVIKYNSMDDVYLNNQEGQIRFVGNDTPGVGTIEYNDFRRTTAGLIDFGSSAKLTLKYNYSQGIGTAGNHADWFIFNSPRGTNTVIDEAFNTVYADPTSQSGTAFCYLSGNSGTTINGGCQNDTYVDISGFSYVIRFEPGSSSGNSMYGNNNYIDSTGGYGPIESRNSAGTATVTCSGNKNLVTGEPITGSFGFVTCN
jgi:hypothetical protein